MYTDEDAPPETNTYGNNEEENENDTNWTPGGLGNERKKGGFQKGNGGFLEYIRRRREEAERGIRFLQSKGAGRILQEAEYSDEIKQGIAAAEALGASDIIIIDGTNSVAGIAGTCLCQYGTIKIVNNAPRAPSFMKVILHEATHQTIMRSGRKIDTRMLIINALESAGFP